MRHAIGILLCFFSLQAWAADIAVSGAWARATAPGQDSGAIEFSVVSKQAAKLVAVASPVAGSTEIHSMAQVNGRMVMRPVESVDLPAGKKVSLGGNYHVMLTGLKHPLKAGDPVPLKLTVEFADKHRETVEAKALVKPLDTGRDMGGMRDTGDMHGMGGMKGM